MKNLLAHAAIGVGILLAAYFMPVSAPLRIGILILVVTGNIIRMRLAKKKSTDMRSEGDNI